MCRGSWNKGHTISSSEPHTDLEAPRNKSDMERELPAASVGDLQGAGEKGVASHTRCDVAIALQFTKVGHSPAAVPEENLI